MKRNYRLKQVVDALVNAARAHGHRLAGLDDLTIDDIVEKHKRAHTVPVMPKHARHAERFNPCDCAIAHAVQDLPECYGAVVLRRITYLLEKDDKGNLKIFRYNSPDQARRLTVRFDKGLGTKRTIINFTPVAESRTLAAGRTYQKRWARGVTKKGHPPKFNALSFTRRHAIPK